MLVIPHRALVACLTAGIQALQIGLSGGRYTAVAATGITGDGLVYQLLADGTARITGFTADSAKLTVPAAIDGAPVTAIGDDAFAHNTTLRAVHLPASVTRIGSGALAVQGLEQVSIVCDTCTIAADAFGGDPGVVLHGWCDSTARAYAAAQGHLFMSHPKADSGAPTLSISSLQATPEQLAVQGDTLTLSIWLSGCSQVSMAAVGLWLPDGLTYVRAGAEVSVMCVVSARCQFVWLPLIAAAPVSATALGYVTVSVSEAVEIGDRYALALADRNFFGDPATVDGTAPRLSDGIIEVVSAAATSAQSVTTTTTSAARGEKGDVDQDGEVNIQDAYLALVAYAQEAAGLDPGLSPAQIWAADLDDDGGISLRDAYGILLYYAQAAAGNHPSPLTPGGGS